MSIPRTKGLSTKLTDDEYTELEGAAGEQTLSVWAREVLLKAARRQAAESVVVAEVLALRTIFLNLQYAQFAGDAVTAERMQQLIDRADRDRFTRAAERLAEAARRACDEAVGRLGLRQVGPARDASVRRPPPGRRPCHGRGDRRVSVRARCGRRSSASTWARMCGARWRGRPADRYELWQRVDRTGRRLALDEDLVTVTSATGDDVVRAVRRRRHRRGDGLSSGNGSPTHTPRSTPSSAAGSITIRPCSIWRNRRSGAPSPSSSADSSVRVHSRPSTRARGARGTPRVKRTTPGRRSSSITGRARHAHRRLRRRRLDARPTPSSCRSPHGRPRVRRRAIAAGEVIRPRGMPPTSPASWPDPFFK